MKRVVSPMIRFGPAATLAAAALLATACNGIVDPSKNVLETFTGTIPVQGTATAHAFSTNNTGEYTIKVVSLAPSTNVFVGVIWAQALVDGTCGGNLPILSQNGFVTNNTVALTGAIYPGAYCVFLYDVGTFTVPETYTVTVSHP